MRLALPLAFLALAACQSVPFTGRNRLLLISEGEERKLGEQAYRETLQKAKLSTDREQTELIRRVGHRLAKAADRPDFRWEFSLIDDPKQINAFCLPGGKVAFYSGILPVTKDEQGVAVVMGHEIAHALARHGGERMSQGLLANFGGQALSVLLANNPAATRGLYEQAYGLGVGLGVLLPYGRKQESEADQIGLILMTKAGYEPGEAVSFWRRMAEATKDKEGGSSLASFLRTHPANDVRIRQIEAWLPEVRAKYGRPTPASP